MGVPCTRAKEKRLTAPAAGWPVRHPRKIRKSRSVPERTDRNVIRDVFSMPWANSGHRSSRRKVLAKEAAMPSRKEALGLSCAALSAPGSGASSLRVRTSRSVPW